ncbi:MAG: CpaF family protein [Lachnospiraceae bacterium]|nr:CpaF family protein [Lachnospiraceae bacterium]
MRELQGEIRERVLAHLDMTQEQTDEEVRELIERCILEVSGERFISLEEKRRLAREVFLSIRKLDFLQELIDDESVTEIMVNGPDAIFVEKDGKLYRAEERFESGEKLENVIQQIVASCNRVVNEASPIVDARLENGARVHVVLAPVALNGPILTIRRFPERPMCMEDLLRRQSLPKEAAELLKKLVKAGYNIFISGGTGSGKTTFLNALSEYIPPAERVITIEDSAELQLISLPNLVRLETRNANVEGCREITIRDLIRASLRMRPDRVIVGEVRGSEAVDMLQCLNTGHDGSLSTGHANSASDMLYRLETMVLMGMELPLAAIRGQIASGVDVIVHLGRLRDRSRRVLEIAEILGYEDGVIRMQSLYQFEEEGEDDEKRIIGTLRKRAELYHTEKLCAAGLS